MGAVEIDFDVESGKIKVVKARWRAAVFSICVSNEKN